LSDILGVKVSEETLHNMKIQCFNSLEVISSNIQSLILASNVVNFDGTGLRVNGKPWWLAAMSWMLSYSSPKSAAGSNRSQSLMQQQTNS
jgi:Transposase IS66 family